jgi:two-component system, chemotaxis family, sensor kinase CheA
MFTQFHRIVRDLSIELNKKGKLVIIGDELEIDKNIAENIGDPLIHILRNSMEHGIEEPNIRVTNGKQEDGSISILL